MVVTKAEFFAPRVKILVVLVTVSAVSYTHLTLPTSDLV